MTKNDAVERAEKSSYDAGYDCGVNGASMSNCHYGHFATPEKTAAWERGKAQGERAIERKKGNYI